MSKLMLEGHMQHHCLKPRAADQGSIYDELGVRTCWPVIGIGLIHLLIIVVVVDNL